MSILLRVRAYLTGDNLDETTETTETILSRWLAGDVGPPLPVDDASPAMLRFLGASE